MGVTYPQYLLSMAKSIQDGPAFAKDYAFVCKVIKAYDPALLKELDTSGRVAEACEPMAAKRRHESKGAAASRITKRAARHGAPRKEAESAQSQL
jgi:hypothetical protein